MLFADLSFLTMLEIASLGLTILELSIAGYNYVKNIYPSFMFHTVGGSNMVVFNEQFGVVAAC